jgi:glucokinase
MKYALGIDIGGTNTAFGLVSENGSIIIEKSFSTKNYNTPQNLANEIFEEKSIQENIDNILGIGIGAPNGNHFTGNIEYAPNLSWKGIIPIKQIFQNQFNKPTILTNDANAAAVGEKIFGTAKNFKNFVTITLGTGLGSGIYINDNIIYGANGMAGEFGHIRVIPNGRLCKCGRKGCLETYASSTGVVRSIQELDSDNKKISKLQWIDNCDAKQLFDIANEGDLFANEIIDFTAEILGNSLADFACFSDPEAFILFGGIAQNGQSFADKVKTNMEKNILPIYSNKIKILISELHEFNAAVLGNAASVFNSIKGN